MDNTDNVDQLIDAAVEAAADLPSPRPFQVWCDAYRTGRSEEEAVKRAFRAVWAEVAGSRYDDFLRVLSNAESQGVLLGHDELVSWTQAAAARAVLELIQSRRLQSNEAARERETRAGDIAAAALRLAQAARRAPRLPSTSRRPVRARCLV